MGEGLAIMAFDKHRRQPAVFASPLPTQRVPSALALRSILVVAGQTQRAQPRPHRGEERPCALSVPDCRVWLAFR